jgi:hypothetical protein
MKKKRGEKREIEVKRGRNRGEKREKRRGKREDEGGEGGVRERGVRVDMKYNE